MLNVARDNPPFAAMLFATIANGIALASEYGGGLTPCELCHWQRYAYLVAMLLGAAGWAAGGKAGRVLALLAGIAILGSAGIAAFHVGVEQKWWEGLPGCTGTIDFSGMTTEEMQQALQDTAPVRCDEPAWTFFGISMAGFNLIYGAVTGVIVLFAALRNSEPKAA